MIVERAYDCFLIDIQGNKYIDTTMGSGAQIIGHNNNLIKNIGEQICQGTIYTVSNLYTQQVNQMLKRYINPDLHDEYVFCSTGTEANMRAIRLARAFTGKTKIGRFHGGWHGGLDGFLEEHQQQKGIPAETNKLFTVLSYNDESCFDQIDDTFAAIIVEPVQGSNPREDVGEFLQKLRQKCSSLGILLIFDEVMTGFRLSKYGGAGIFNIRPDLVTYGKVLGGGFPIGALGGRQEIMQTDGVFYGGTFSGNPLSMYAALLMLETIVEERCVKYDYLNYIGSKFRNDLNHFFINNQKQMRVMGCGPLSRIIFTDKYIKNRQERDLHEIGNQERFYEKLKQQGVFVNTNRLFHFSMSHELEVIEEIIDRIRSVSYEQN